MPGALDSTWASPCGNTMRSPSSRWIGGSPTTCPQHEPRAIGVLDHALGSWHYRRRDLARRRRLRHPRRAQVEVEYTAPVRRTERSTSDRTSADMPARGAPDALGIPFGRRGMLFAHLDGLPSKSDARAWLQHHISHSVDVPRNAAWLVSKDERNDTCCIARVRHTAADRDHQTREGACRAPRRRSPCSRSRRERAH